MKKIVSQSTSTNVVSSGPVSGHQLSRLSSIFYKAKFVLSMDLGSITIPENGIVLYKKERNTLCDWGISRTFLPYARFKKDGTTIDLRLDCMRNLNPSVGESKFKASITLREILDYLDHPDVKADARQSNIEWTEFEFIHVYDWIQNTFTTYSAKR